MLYCCHFDCVLSLRLFCKSVVLWLHSSSYQYLLYFLGICLCDIFGVVAWGPIMVRKSNESQRCLGVEDELCDSRVNALEVCWVCSPVGSRQEEVSKVLLWTFRNEFGVSKGLVISCVINHCWHIDEYLFDSQLVEFLLESFYCLLCSLLKAFENQVDKCWWFIGSLKETYSCSIPRSLCEVVGVEGLLRL